ncbi:hypothetical protein O6H91_11G061300 [Diphasiastrum complanatum]|uniref:Uncharacterized protein n=1 Tax=Diphasiastrum complanatum TaxID=34168 RepID=A0ACC2C9P5_DIPCM|nr:hypothetical protein O6H91_11G061300 [Diphasiastrum complanatum]
MADDRSHSDCEDVSSQWDVVSVSGISEPDSEQNVVGEQAMAEAEVHSDHFDCPLSPALSPQAHMLEEFSISEFPPLEEADRDQFETDTLLEATVTETVANFDDEEAAEKQEPLQNVIDQNSYAEKSEVRGVGQGEQHKKGIGMGDMVERMPLRVEHEHEAWWMHQACILRAQARQTNGLWSIALAASLMGLVVVGQRWHHERYQNQQLRLQLSAKDEKVNQLLVQVTRLKRTLSTRRHVQVHRGKTCYHGFADCF